MNPWGLPGNLSSDYLVYQASFQSAHSIDRVAHWYMAGRMLELPHLDWLHLAGLLLVTSVAVLAYRRYGSPISDVPGPWAASLSRLWHIRCILKGNQNVEMVRLHDRLGHFVRIAPNEVSVSHPDSIKKVLSAPLHKGSWYKVIAVPDARFQNPMSATDPKTKNELSRHLAAGYTLSSLLQAESSVDEVIGLLLDWLDDFSASGRPIELDQWLTYTTADLLGETIFSKQFGFLREGRNINGAIATSRPHTTYITFMGFFRWLHVSLLSNRVVTWLGVTPWGHLIGTGLAAIREREANPSARFDIAAHWFRFLEKHPGRMKRHEIDSAVFSALAAGYESVSCASQAFVYFMIRHPDAWQRVRAEIDAAGLHADRVVGYAETQRLPFLQACIKEALRIFPPAPMGLPRVVPKGGLALGDRTIPEGTTVSVSVPVMHSSTEIWGPDARQFNPDRWLSDEAGCLEKYLIPWGAGYASCPGQNVAKIELSKLCATLVRDYDFRQVDPAQEWKYKAFFTVIPHDWPCYIKRRKGDA